MTYMRILSSSVETFPVKHRNSGASRTVRVAAALVLASVMMAGPVEAQTWSQRTSNTAQNLVAVVYSTAGTAAAVGANTAITVSGDGGSTWTDKNLGLAATLNAVFSNGVNIATVGDDQGGGANEVTAASADRGATWALTVEPGNDDNIEDGLFVNSTNGVAVVSSGTGAILNSSDSGGSWTVNAYVPADFLQAVDSRGTLVIAVGNDAGGIPTIARSSDSGVTFVAATSAPVTNEILRDVVVVSTTDAVAVGGGTGGTPDNILYSSNAGVDWTNPFDAADNQNAVDASSSFVVAVGDNGTISRSIDGGATWAAVVGGANPAPPTNLNDVLFLTSSILLAVGDGGLIIGSTDRGVTWTAQNSGVNENLQRIAYNGLTKTLVVGNAGTILLSLNQISVTAPIPFQSKWLLVGLLLAAGLLALRRYGPAR